MVAGIWAWLVTNALKIGAVLAICGAVFVYIDRKATYRERAKWEEKVRVAEAAAKKQDEVATERANKKAKLTIDYLSKQKALDDAAIIKLQADLKSRKNLKRCIVDEYYAQQLRD